MAKKLCITRYLPEDIIFQLLLFLSVRSLFRFKSVCKSWRSIISDHQFVQAHAKQASSLENTALVVVNHKRTRFIDKIYLVSTPNSTEDLAMGTELQLPQQFHDKIRVVDHCNGLVCLSNFDVICLWNPATKQYKKLPNPKIPRVGICGDVMIGLGFDSISNDYKVLRFGFVPGTQDGHFRFVTKAEMYSANADSWVEIHQIPGKKFPQVYSPCFHTETGVLCFEGFSDMMQFDLHNEVFRVHEFPDSMRSYRKSNILDFRGSVATIIRSAGNGDGDESVYSLWTLLDDGCGKVSWTKKFNLALDLNFSKSRVCCFLGSAYFVALKRGVDECIFYDYYKNREIKVHLRFAKAVGGQHALVVKRPRTLVVKYAESLVSLKGFEQVE